MPTVVAVMLTRNRPELAARAVDCFRKQTYKAKRLLIFDSSRRFYKTGEVFHAEDICHIADRDANDTIGILRNRAADEIQDWFPEASIIVHWDDDDYSHPNRIAEQVAFLQETGAQAVGYNALLFARIPPPQRPEVWLFSYSKVWRNKVLGTSLCYWRKTWEAKPFPDEPKNRESSGEDTLWMQGLDVRGCSSLRDGVPRMIARIHGGNFGAYDIEGAIKGGSQEWKRVSEWDNRVREILE